MSRCRPFLDQILEADVDELDGSADTALSVHIRSCERCAKEARKVIEANERLDQTLSTAPPLDVAALLARAKLEAVSTQLEAASTHTPDTSTRRAWRLWASLAAAASIGTLMLLGQREVVLPGVALMPPEADQPLVETPDDRNVAVMQTDNPDITVLWFF